MFGWETKKEGDCRLSLRQALCAFHWRCEWGEVGAVKVRILEPPCFSFYDWPFFMGWTLQLAVWIAAQGDRVPIKCWPAGMGPPVQPWDRLYRQPYELRPLLKPGRAALRNLGPGNKRKIGVVCYGLVQSWGLKLKADQVWKFFFFLSGVMCVLKSLSRLACVSKFWFHTTVFVS